MSTEEHLKLANIIKEARQEKGYSASELARRAGLQPSTVTRIEAAQLQHPQPETLIVIAHALEKPTSDLFACLNWLPKEQLPSFTPYLRAKYADLPEQVLEKLENHVAKVVRRYGYETNGPEPGQDEF
ncbi:helix-turn-helix protein [Kribbella voronezhensis]|uniref:Helix-turn-helix protein n=1 Tax=Kribbella voronezhensis TaxID=2512212 RepID=A0A4R7T8C6_9ACTN|nr:helix-turn-helix transcriptional regulator [Kribbella voronezhensis]TDU87586.1 helix-turn-helix protein [Kribbella voronezhensis]